MKTNRYFAIAIVAILLSVAVWVILEARATFQPALKNKESANQNIKGLNITLGEYETFKQIVMKSQPVYASNDKAIDILKGLGAIKLLIETDLEPEIERLGLTEQALQTDIELLLRKYGIEISQNPELSYLYIRLNVVKNDLSLIFSITVGFQDTLIPIRNPAIMIIGATVWENCSVGCVGKARIGNIREAVEDVVKVFINDYLAANPKEQSK